MLGFFLALLIGLLGGHAGYASQAGHASHASAAGHAGAQGHCPAQSSDVAGAPASVDFHAIVR